MLHKKYVSLPRYQKQHLKLRTLILLLFTITFFCEDVYRLVGSDHEYNLMASDADTEETDDSEFKSKTKDSDEYNCIFRSIDRTHSTTVFLKQNRRRLNACISPIQEIFTPPPDHKG